MIIKVFIKCRIFSVETTCTYARMRACTHMHADIHIQTHTYTKEHEHTDYTKLKLELKTGSKQT